MDEALERFAKVPRAQKLLGLVVLMAALAGGYYTMVYADLQEQQATLLREVPQLEKEQADYRKRKTEYLAYKREIERLVEEQKALLKKLPRKDEIATLLESIHAQGEVAGLQILSFTPMDEAPVDLYIKIPVAMEISGTYHQLGKFFRQLGDLPRVVSVENVSMKLATERKTADRDKVPLRASLLASAFRFRDEAPPAPTAAPNTAARR
jgi:type IV pilus assembly protein PilO